MRLMKKELLASRQRQQLHKKEPDGVRKLQGMLALIALCTAGFQACVTASLAGVMFHWLIMC